MSTNDTHGHLQIVLLCVYIYIYIIMVDGCAWWIYVDQNPSMLVTAMLMFDFFKFTRISDENLRFCG